VIRDPLLLTAVVVGVTALAFLLDREVAPLSKIGASLLVILFGAVLSNAGLVPAASPVYDVILGPVTSVAIAWLLLAVDLRDLKRAGPQMLGAFGLALAGTMAGAALGALLFASAFGEDTWRLAGTLAGTYSGGSVNFVAVAREVELPDALLAVTTWVVLLASGPIARALGRTGLNVATRFMGLILAAIAVEFIASGLLDIFPAWGTAPD